MKYLVILFILFPILLFAGENKLTIQKDLNIHAWSFKEGMVTYYTDCRDIGGQCRQRCSDGELSIGHLSSANEGRNVYPYCGKCTLGKCTPDQFFKSYDGVKEDKCCLPKSKTKQ
jgi:hypothetical protein